MKTTTAATRLPSLRRSGGNTAVGMLRRSRRSFQPIPRADKEINLGATECFFFRFMVQGDGQVSRGVTKASREMPKANTKAFVEYALIWESVC